MDRPSKGAQPRHGLKSGPTVFCRAIALDDPTATARLQALYDVATCFVMPSLHEPSAQAYIEAGSGGHFDPAVVAALQATRPEFERIARQWSSEPAPIMEPR